jgi:hypothetical protein
MDVTLLRDADWAVTEGYPCRVTGFDPVAEVTNVYLNEFGKVKRGDVISTRRLPFATVEVECSRLPTNTRANITHKLDFIHLWIVFKWEGVKQDEEVVVFWLKSYLKWYAAPFAWFMPRLRVMVCKKEAYELMVDPYWKPELQGLERWNAQKPIVDWKPEVLE